MRVLLLENIHPESVKIFSSSSLAQDCKVESFKKSLSEDELIKELESNLEKKEGKEEEKEKEEENDKKQVVIGIRSVTKLSSQIINNSSCSGLRAIGCYSIGFDGVDLRAASLKGIPVFNSQFSSTHSVAELIIAQIINLARRIGDNIFKMRSGQWEKSAENKIEIRGQTLGIVGYGHIGSTVGILASSLGMNVVFYDIVPKLAYGNAKQVSTLQECLSSSNFVTLHVTGGGSRPLAPQSLIGKNSGDKDRKGIDDKDMKEEKKDERAALIIQISELKMERQELYTELSGLKDADERMDLNKQIGGISLQLSELDEKMRALKNTETSLEKAGKKTKINDGK